MIAPEALRERVAAIVIGTSAGGVEALSVLLPALTSGLKVPVFVVLHLPRGRPSLLTKIFANKCAVPVREANDKDPARPGTVYFAPPDYHLLLEKEPLPAQGTLPDQGMRPADGPLLALSVDELVHYSRPSIDVLFESAADYYGDRLLGIILTGANEDGAAGLEKIHAEGGITVAQDPGSAFEARMVLAAIGRCRPDFVLPLGEIAMLLATLGEPAK